MRSGGFSLLELLVAMAVLALMAVLMLSVTSSAQRMARQTTSRVEQFREARRAFERINQRLSQATLNPYFDYVNSSGQPRTTNNASSFAPKKYARISELRYLQTNATSFAAQVGGTPCGKAVFFQAPLGKSDSLSGLNSLVNTVGYYVKKGDDSGLRPPTVSGPARTRYRMFEFVEPTENLTIYSLTSGNATYSGNGWITTPLGKPAYSHRLADNIVALVLRADYQDASGTPKQDFDYSSAPQGAATQAITENNLPPNVRVTMIAVDEPSARRIEEQNITLNDAQDDAGLATLEAALLDKKLNYRKFESAVSIGPAKWSGK